MKKLFLMGTSLCMVGVLATNVWAFGGMGIGHKSSSHKGGVDAIGIHINPNDKQADIKIVECSGNGVKGVDDNCYCHQGYTGTNCETKLCETGSYCGMDGDNPLCCPGDHICTTAGDVLGTCFRAESGCTTNADCEAGEFCKVGHSYTGGTCESVGQGVPSNEVKDGNGNIVFSQGQFLVSPDDMNWPSARNWCLAQNKTLIQLSSFKTSTNISEEDGYCDYPCGEAETCDYKNDYDGTDDTIQIVCKALGSFTPMSPDDDYYGRLLSYMRQAIGGQVYWTDDDFNNADVLFVQLNNGAIVYDARFSYDYPTYALCE